MMQLRPLGARLTARQTELILAHFNDFLDLGTGAIEAADLCRRQCETMGGEILGAVSDNQDFQPPSQPASLGPVGMAPLGPKRLPIEPAILFETADKIPAVISNALEEGF